MRRLGKMHRTRQHRLLGLVIGRLVLDYLVNDDLEQRCQLVPLVLLLLELVEEAGERLGPALVHLDHLRLHVQQHVVDVIEVLLSEGLQNEKAAGVIQDHAFVAFERKVANCAQKLRLVHRLEVHLTFRGLLVSRLDILLGRVELHTLVDIMRLSDNINHRYVYIC